MARTSDIDIFLRNLPQDGSPIGNGNLRSTLGWHEERYEKAKNLLLARKAILKGTGKGGSVRRSDGALPSRLRVFISYAHEDAAHQTMLKKHLQPLVREQKIEIWTDGLIRPGDEWAKEIAEGLAKAEVVILLVSIDFLNSDYCYNEEMKEAVARHDRREARVIPIIVRPCQWTLAPFAKLQLMPKKDPKVLPVELFPHREDAYDSIATDLRKIIEEKIG